MIHYNQINHDKNKECFILTYNHISIDELNWIEAYWERGEKVAFIAQKLNRSLQTIYNVINFLKQGRTVQEYYTRYCNNKKRCGAKKKCYHKKM